MSFPLFDYVKSLVPHLRKDDIIEDLRVTKGELESHRQVYDKFLKDFGDAKWKSPHVESLAKVFYRNFKSSNGKATALPIDVARAIGPMLSNLATIDKELDQTLSGDVLNEGLSAKKAILVRACEHLSFLSRYSLDVMNYILAAETTKDQPLDHSLSKASIEYIESNILTYAQLLTIYSKPADQFAKQMLEIPDVVISSSNANAVGSVYSGARMDPYMSLTTKGFMGSPIYHIGMVFAEWQANRYKVAKDKRQMLELRLMQLKMVQEDLQDPGLEKQIIYLQDRIDKLDRKLEEMER